MPSRNKFFSRIFQEGKNGQKTEKNPQKSMRGLGRFVIEKHEKMTKNQKISRSIFWGKNFVKPVFVLKNFGFFGKIAKKMDPIFIEKSRKFQNYKCK